MAWWRIVVCVFGGLVHHTGSDTTPPALSVVNVHAFIFHILVTVNLNEEGTVWCGAVLDSGTGTVAPSVVQLKASSAPLAGTGTSAVSANTQVNVAIVGLNPGTVYDVYCYAEDQLMNGLSIASIASTKQEGVVTASGGDYNRPTFSYIAPYELVESTTIRLYVQLDEDGTVWCVAKRDTGSGTTEPTSGEITGNVNVDAWAVATIVAQNLYNAEMQLHSLLEGSTYDVYCFAKDVAGNGIDNTPAFTQDTTAITATKRSGIVTDTSLVASTFRVSGASSVVQYTVEPATWNAYLPNMVVSGNQERRDLESWNAPLMFLEAWLVSHSNHDTRGCTRIPPAPPGFIWLALVRRGGCTFQVKAAQAYLAGYQALLVINSQSGTALPDMTTNGQDEATKIPSWIISKADGETLVQAITTSPSPLAAFVEDVRRKPRLGQLQSDSFGVRTYVTN